MHIPAEQYLVPKHSTSLVHGPKHPVGPHTNGSHCWVCSAGHAPAPLHTARSVASLVALQSQPRHSVEAPGKAQAVVKVPLQLPPHSVPSLAHAGLLP